MNERGVSLATARANTAILMGEVDLEQNKCPKAFFHSMVNAITKAASPSQTWQIHSNAVTRVYSLSHKLKNT